MRVRMLPMWAAGAAIAAFAIATPALRAGAAPASACTATAGVTVIVDFTYFHHDIERGCAPGHPASALAALHAAGFETAGTTQYGDAFVCRIDGLPSPAKESCAQTPPAKSSWSFYTARPTDPGWEYATSGASLVRPESGTLVAFAFGSYAKPGIRPSAGVATPTTSTIAPRPPVTTTTTVAPLPATVSAQSSSTTVGPAAATSTPGAPTTTRPAPAPATSPTTSLPAASTSTRAPRVVDHTAARTSSGNSSGSPVPVALTGALVAVLGLGAGLISAARRRSSA